MVHKILHGRGELDPSTGTWFEKADSAVGTTRRSVEDPFNLKMKHGRLEVRTNFFIVREIMT